MLFPFLIYDTKQGQPRSVSPYFQNRPPASGHFVDLFSYKYFGCASSRTCASTAGYPLPPKNLLVKAARFNEHPGDDVRVNVSSRAPVLKIAAASFECVVTDTARCPAVCDAPTEDVDGSRFMLAGETGVVALTVRRDMLFVLLSELLERWDDGGLVASRSAHGCSREVGMASCAVPVSLDRLWCVGNIKMIHLRDSLKQIAGHPEHVTLLNAGGGTDLILPLAGCDLGVDAGDLDSSVDAGLEVGVDDVAAVHLGARNAAVVRALSLGLRAIFREADWQVSFRVHDEVLLLEAEPWLEFCRPLHSLGTRIARVGGERDACRGVGIAHNENVGGAAERIREDSLRLEDHLGVLSRCLIGGRAVIVPLWELGHILRDSLEDTSLTAEAVVPVNPNVLRNARVLDRKGGERFNSGHIC